ncbi:MAG: methyltransferase domain-containing protein [Firmicutes bacterium]|nr:methyltransferase domain-containing protein [Bacillota bacterium]
MHEQSLFQCPVCSEVLFREQKQYFCQNKHSFDRARQGYVNLLLPRHTGAGNPGDTREMLQSRRAFLDRGYYEEFSRKLNETVANTLSSAKEAQILDAGCGEGYYTWRLKNYLAGNSPDIYGIDVSRTAIQYAAGRDRSISFAVASNYHIPVLDDALDCIICVFAPRDEGQFSRVLKPTGTVVVAAPGTRHLNSLRKRLSVDPERLGSKGDMAGGFSLMDTANVTYDICLENEDILNLLQMTPYSRHVEAGAVAALEKVEKLEITVDIDIRVYKQI